MKKTLYTLLAISALLLASCKKDNDDNNPGGGSNTYQPFTAGSEWKYRTEIDLGEGAPLVDTSVNTMTAQTKTINNKKYYVAKSVDDEGTEETYLGLNNNVYSTIISDELAGKDLEFAYLNESKAVNESWETLFTIDDEDGDIEARLKTTIKEKSITKTVLGKSYNNVIHTIVETGFKINNNWVTVAQMDFYIAKGIGMIATYGGVNGNISAKTELMSYNIK
ncbi:hypothetical protein LT679_18355 [Mucilaginibacter roseus]|uniref:Lipid/polyisoprenoid-binding YceI-like domain-containing protein n=1 Tax=Mucilaginibacter roseus TaxID=1528868 RepID=A0ABS8U642_9SPHI|nr:hypothetical protein [Mucilaginibacter roseus]MCD8742579.1 hypothetical protein [Mucilaginibacter roseus]